jgi:transcriptional regulator with XRE-family HTH domain
MGRTQQYLSRRVAGYVPFDVADLADIANYLNTPVESFFQAAPTIATAKK